jgi:hypothetical protein
MSSSIQGPVVALARVIGQSVDAGFGLGRGSLRNAATAVEASREAARNRRDAEQALLRTARSAELRLLSRAN